MTDDVPLGSTPIDDDEAADLIPTHVQHRSQLNLWEQQNILEAVKWGRRTRQSVLDERLLRELHKRMFDRTWKWAGYYRKTNKNIGVDWHHIPVEVKILVDDGSFWLKEQVFPIDVAALRLHHRLVLIHPFPNGNGRLGRLWCDVILQQNGRPPFPWKNALLDNPGLARRAYIDALRFADRNDYGPLERLILVDRDRP